MNRYSECGIISGGLNTGGNLSESSFLEALFGLEFGHADFADDADFCPMQAGISQIMQMTQIFFAAHLSPITIFWKKSDKLLVIKGAICVTDT